MLLGMYRPTDACWTELRPELLRRPRADGGLELLDPIAQRIVEVTAAVVAGFQDGDPQARLTLSLQMVLDDETAEQLRDNAWAAKSQLRVPPAAIGPGHDAAPHLDDVNFDDAAQLPRLVSAWWRDGEQLRRLTEERRAGRRYHVLRGFFDMDAARSIRDAVSALAFSRMETDLLTCERHLVAGDELSELVGLMQSDLLRRLLSPIVGRVLPAGTVVNAWRLSQGDSFGIHPDGPRYQGTFSVGLCDRWTARDGGAIAFGEPTSEHGFIVAERWLPQLGDLLVFAPDHDTWHAVEPVMGDRTRLTLTGFWTGES